MKPNQRKALTIAGLFLRIRLFLLNSKLYSKLAILKEKEKSDSDESKAGQILHLMSRAVFEADRA